MIAGNTTTGDYDVVKAMPYRTTITIYIYIHTHFVYISHCWRNDGWDLGLVFPACFRFVNYDEFFTDMEDVPGCPEKLEDALC